MKNTVRVGVGALGVLAVVAAGLVVGDAGSRLDGRPTSRRQPVAVEPPPGPAEAVAVQPAWDPRSVDELQVADDPLPDRIEPPRSAPALRDAPVPAALLSVARGTTLLLLSTDGEWRSVGVPRSAWTALSDLGTGLVVQHDSSLEVWHLPTGRRTEIPFPDGLEPWDFTRTVWVDEATLLIDDHAGGWRVDVATGASSRVPYPRRHLWAIDPAGSVVEVAGFDEPPVLSDWATGTARQVSAPVRLASLVAGATTVAGTTYGSEPFAVVAADRADLEPRATLPVEDFEGNDSSWALRPVALRDDGTVLLWVAIPGPARRDGWRLVTWDPGSGALAVVSASDAGPVMLLRFAKGLLAATNS